MKKMLTFVTLVVVLALAAAAEAQTTTGKRWFNPGPILSVTNQTDKVVRLRFVYVAGVQRDWQGTLYVKPLGLSPADLPFSYDRGLVSVSADVCRDFEEFEALISPPEWTRDTQRFGAAALTDDFLGEPPSEPDLKGRVRFLKEALDATKALGRGEMKSDLDGWLKDVRKHGLIQPRVSCIDPVPAGTVQLYTDANWPEGRARALVISPPPYGRGGYVLRYVYGYGGY